MSNEVKYMGSTKKEIWDAYKALKEQADANQSTVTTTTDAANQAKVATAVQTASSVDVDSVSASVSTLVTKVAEAKDQYNSIIEAIDAKKAELKSIHDLEVEANSLVAVVATKDQLIAQKDAQAKEIIASAQEQADSIIATAKARKDEITANINQINAETSQKRQREQEEYEYNFERKKKADLDSLQDTLSAKTKVIIEREEAVAEREAIADATDKEIASLKGEIEVLNQTMDARIATAYDEAKEKATKSAKFAETILRKDYESKIEIKDAKIETLEEKVEALSRQLDKANDLVADAQNKVASMASNALQAKANAETVSEVAKIAAGAGNKK